MTWGRRGRERPLVIAHRGASRKALENTLPAFRLARADGADGVELDVHACATGEVVVFHDDDLRRLAGREERIADLPLGELRRVELTGAAGSGRISTLEEVLEELGPMLVNVEIKAPRAVTVAMARLVPAVARILRRRSVGGSVLVSSFNPIALGMLRALAPRVPTGLLFRAEQGRVLREAWARRLLGVAAVHPERVLVTDSERVQRWQREGFAVNVWTVDDASEVRRLVGMGVDGIITNDPAATALAVAEAVAEAEAETDSETEAEADSDSDSETETETQTDSDSETDSGTETETDSETDSETESKPKPKP